MKCETCNGEGSIEMNVQRDGYPEMNVPVVCSDCNGTGASQESEDVEPVQDKLWLEVGTIIMRNYECLDEEEVTKELKSKYTIYSKQPNK